MKQVPDDERYFKRFQYRVLRLPDEPVREVGFDPAWRAPFSVEGIQEAVNA